MFFDNFADKKQARQQVKPVVNGMRRGRIGTQCQVILGLLDAQAFKDVSFRRNGNLLERREVLRRGGEDRRRVEALNQDTEI